MDMKNHINNHHHTPTTDFLTTTSNNWEERLSMAMEDHPHQANDEQQHQQSNHLHPLIPLLDNHPLWPSNYHHNHLIPTSSPSSFQLHTTSPSLDTRQTLQDEEDEQEDEEEIEELGAMKEMMYRIAVMQPVDIDPATIHKPKRRNVRISNDPQSVAARLRRERISEKIRILQRLVPGGTKMDTASMLDEAIRYVKFLKRQIRQLQPSSNQHTPPVPVPPSGWPPLPLASLVGPTNDPKEAKVVVMRDHHQGIFFQHGGN